MNNDMTTASNPAVLPPVARREPERSEGERSATGGKTGAAPRSYPNPEVVAQAKRRRFNADYKRQILEEADRAKGSGGIGVLLRREGLYSSLLVAWRRERDAGVALGLTPQRRGPKPKIDPATEENARLLRENQRLGEELRRAEIIIDVQKKLASLLAQPTGASGLGATL